MSKRYNHFMSDAQQIRIEGKLIKTNDSWIFEITHSHNGLVMHREAQPIWSDLTPDEAHYAGQCIFNEHIKKVQEANSEILTRVVQDVSHFYTMPSDPDAIHGMPIEDDPFVQLELKIGRLVDYENTYFKPHESRMTPVAFMACGKSEEWEYIICGPIRNSQKEAEADVNEWASYLDANIEVKPIYSAVHIQMINDVVNLASICKIIDKDE